MIHRFATIEIDEPRRELRIAGRVVPLQPKVFELLAYLARHQDRVVPKEELLNAVWPGVIVTDASLQRAVSLARAALGEAGAGEVIRTHARQGYRFCAESPCDRPAAHPGEGALERAHQAYERGAWDEAIAAFHEVDHLEGLVAVDLQRWAHAAQCAGRPHDALGPLQRAVAVYSARGDRRPAAWAAFLLAQLHAEWRESAPARGWYQRATRLLENEPPCRERGYVDLLGSRMALFQNELETCAELAESARAAGVAFQDADLESLAMVTLGEALLYTGRVRDGLAMIDEAGVAVVANNVSPWAGGLVYCGVIFSCMSRADWPRAGQWTDQFTRWCENKGIAAYPGLCRLHRAEVLTVRGELVEAERETRATIALLAKQAPWAEGDAWGALGEILLLRGELEEARRCFQRATELGWESRFGFALVRFAEGDAAGAERLLAQALQENVLSCRARRGQALAQYAIIATAAGRIDEARTALASLDRDRELVATSALQSLVERARGELCAVENQWQQALIHLRAAQRGYLALHAPVAAAEIRCRIADLLFRQGEGESAQLELDAARTALEQAGAKGLLTRCQHMQARGTAVPPTASLDHANARTP